MARPPRTTQEMLPRAIARMVVTLSGGGEGGDGRGRGGDDSVVEIIVVVDGGSGASSPLSWLCECAMSNNLEFYESFRHTHV